MGAAQEASVPTLILEYVDARAVDVDMSTGAVPPAMLMCMRALAQIAPAPERCSLIVTGDFVRSVQDRLPNRPDDATFTTGRGSGMVAAKTMRRVDGTLDVLAPGWFFSSDVDAETRDAVAALAIRTIVHEAHHVAMRQNQQDYVREADQDWRARNFTAAADTVIDEYRAELGTSSLLSETESTWDPLEVLDALSRALGAAAAAYQQHRDVEKLAFDVGSEATVAWRAFAYIAAFARHNPEQSTVTAAVRANPRWARMVAPSWSGFEETLRAVDPGTELMRPEDVSAAVERLAEVLAQWLGDLGFLWSPDGQYRIQEWYFEEPYFLEALHGAGGR